MRTDDVSEVLRAARDAYERQDWPRARELFLAARAAGELSADDLFALSAAAWWMGHRDERARTLQEAYTTYGAADQPREAAMAAIALAVDLGLQGDDSGASGWMSRAQRLLRDDPDAPQHGYLICLLEVEPVVQGAEALDEPDFDALVANARRLHDLGRRHGDPDLVALGILGEGRALVRRGRITEGMALLDEAMLAILSGDMSPEWVGHVYCNLMTVAHELADLRRAMTWTEAATRWLETLPAAVLFTGICRVHRSQIHQVKGAWDRAEREAARVCVDLLHIQPATAAEAHYQVGEVRRLRGDITAAEESYQQAHRLGRDPQPGLALLRLAQGRRNAAAASIRAALVAEARGLPRARLCAAQVEIALACGDVVTARKACEELEDLAATYASSGLEVMARHARGATLLADGHPAEALPVLRDACQRWHDVEAPYDCARIRLLLARAYDALGDADAAALERDVAEELFARLGAARNAGATAAEREGGPRLPDGLTPREAEVLTLVAAGKTNRDIADDLVISQKTVARHLSNIFTKLGLASRTAAAAYAFEHGLATPAAGRG